MLFCCISTVMSVKASCRYITSYVHIYMYITNYLAMHGYRPCVISIGAQCNVPCMHTHAFGIDLVKNATYNLSMKINILLFN